MQAHFGRTSSEFVDQLKPVLEKKDLRGMLDLIETRWTIRSLLEFLSCQCCDARKVAAMSLAWVGCKECIQPLVDRLKDPDPVVHQMAEHALWAIWLRGGNKQANDCVCRAIKSMENQDYNQAIEYCTTALEHSPDFSEAYNQRAIAHYLKEDFRASIRDCRRAIELMPSHFGAWCGLGHCHAHYGETKQAIDAYIKALEINPQMDCVRDCLQCLLDQQFPS